jgi:hypothetical protein
MKKLVLSFLAFITVSLTALAQSPEGFKYQAVGGTAYSVMGKSQLMSVPYALYVKTSGTAAEGMMIYNTTETQYQGYGSVTVGGTSAVYQVQLNFDNAL